MKPEPVTVHHHKPCGHACRCASPIKGGCQKCARDRQRAEFWALVARASQ